MYLIILLVAAPPDSHALSVESAVSSTNAFRAERGLAPVEAGTSEMAADLKNIVDSDPDFIYQKPPNKFPRTHEGILEMGGWCACEPDPETTYPSFPNSRAIAEAIPKAFAIDQAMILFPDLYAAATDPLATHIAAIEVRGFVAVLIVSPKTSSMRSWITNPIIDPTSRFSEQLVISAPSITDSVSWDESTEEDGLTSEVQLSISSSRQGVSGDLKNAVDAGCANYDSIDMSAVTVDPYSGYNLYFTGLVTESTQPLCRLKFGRNFQVKVAGNIHDFSTTTIADSRISSRGQPAFAPGVTARERKALLKMIRTTPNKKARKQFLAMLPLITITKSAEIDTAGAAGCSSSRPENDFRPCYILLRPSMFIDSRNARLTVYHELAHTLDHALLERKKRMAIYRKFKRSRNWTCRPPAGILPPGFKGCAGPEEALAEHYTAWAMNASKMHTDWGYGFKKMMPFGKTGRMLRWPKDPDDLNIWDDTF